MKKLIKTAAIATGALIVAKGLDNRLETTHHTISSKKIPSGFDGFKIVQVSDVHSDNLPDLIPEIKREKPDIIVSTGDIVHHTGGYECAVSLCDSLMDIAPVYAVSGNHDEWRPDYSELRRALSDLGVILLSNRSIELTRNGEKIGISGIDDPFSVVSKKINDYLFDACKKLTLSDGYNILLFHRANWLDYFSKSGFDLIIAGHMHGGQMRVPFFGGVMSPRSSWASGKSILFPKYVGGRYKSNNTELVVSRGLGNPMLIPRMFNRPELVVITLRHKP